MMSIGDAKEMDGTHGASIDTRARRSFALLLSAVLVAGCATVPFDEPKPFSEAVTDTSDTNLGGDVALWTAQHEGLSGFYPLTQGMDALGVRLNLAERAEKSIDLQYFLMKDDTAGAVMTNALLKAADRGVRVRFLLDDVFTTTPDRYLLLIDQHLNIEVRLFNPISRRGFSFFNFAGDFSQANRRMHNKSFTVDNLVSVVGGRNIADEYFQLKTDSVFIDFDILAAGPIASEVSRSFDAYWNHSRAVPMDRVAANEKNEDLDSVRQDVGRELEDVYASTYSQALESDLLQVLISDRRTLFPADARVISDSPDKLISEISVAQMDLANDLLEVILSAEKEIVFISPYYVPGDWGVEVVRNLVDKGVRVVILTNSLASNNHVPVHGAYARYRKDVIRAGAELYEARANAAREAQGSEEGPDTLTMHTKGILIDRRYVFVGSLNLDPRSIEINAEMGLLVDSADMVGAWLSDGDETLARLAYRVSLNERDDLEWRTTIDGEDVVETKEPLSSGWRRFQAWFLKIAPESQL
jgi:putative cardiolipin synthase